MKGWVQEGLWPQALSAEIFVSSLVSADVSFFKGSAAPWNSAKQLCLTAAPFLELAVLTLGSTWGDVQWLWIHGAPFTSVPAFLAAVCFSFSSADLCSLAGSVGTKVVSISLHSLT